MAALLGMTTDRWKGRICRAPSKNAFCIDARDLSAGVDLLLTPLGQGGDRYYRTASFDLDADQPIEQEPQIAAEDAILIVDGTFLQRAELRGHWDATVLVRTSAEVSEARGIDRDMERLGGEAAARDLYANRYRPAYVLYERLCEPERHSDAIIDNDDPTHPRLHVRPDGRLT
jgi:uridine kinase